MSSDEIIKAILDVTGYKAATFASFIGVPRHAVADVKCGKIKNISPSLQKAICGKFPHFNPIWILTGEGNMYLPAYENNNIEITRTGDIKNSVVGNNSTNNNGGDNEIISKLLNELAAQRKQNDELIALLKSQIEK